MRRLLNIRGFLLLAIGFAVGIICAYMFWRNKIVFVIANSSIIGLLVVIGIIFKYKNLLFAISLVGIAFLCGLWGTNARINVINSRDIFENVSVRGVVTDVSFNPNDSGYGKYFLRDVWVFDGEKTTELDGGVQVRFALESIDVGDEVVFTADVFPLPILSDGVQTYLIKNKIFYTCENIKEVSASAGYASIPERIRGFVRTTLTENMGADSGSVAVGLLIGDKAFMDNNLSDAYKKTGIAHIFAVSGLHVGFVAGLFTFIVRKLRLRNWISLFVTIVPILFYAWICGFSPSVVRAAVMSLSAMFLGAIGAKGDMLSSASFAMIVILAINPFYLFDGGFQMSFAAVYGIAVFSVVKIGRLDKNRNKFLNGVLSSAYLSIGASLGTFPFVVHYYGMIPVFSLLLNLLIIPFVSIIFILLWVGMIPCFNFILAIPDFFIETINTVVEFVSYPDFATIPLKSFGIGALVFLVLLFILGGFLNISRKSKTISCLCLAVVFVVCAVICQFPKLQKFEITMINSRSATALFTDNENNAVVISEFSDYESINKVKTVCAEKGIESFDIIVLKFDDFQPRYVLDIYSQGARVNVMYKMTYDSDAEKELILTRGGVKIINSSQGVSIGDGMSFVPVYINGKTLGVNVSFYNRNVFVSFCDGTYREIQQALSKSEVGFDILLLDNTHEELADFGGMLLTNNYTKSKNFYSSKCLGNFTLRVLNDKIILLA